MISKEDLARHVYQRLQWGMDSDAGAKMNSDAGAENVNSAAPAAPETQVAEQNDERSLRPLLSCPEEQFANMAILTILQRNPAVPEVLEICNRRGNGVSRARIVRDLLQRAAEENIVPPHDWQTVLPRHIDVSRILHEKHSRDEFIAAAYELVLRRSPGAVEVRSHRGRLRWITRSDFLVALAASEEASQGGEIILHGLGRRSPSLQRFLHQIAGRNYEEKDAEPVSDALMRENAALRKHLAALQRHADEETSGRERLQAACNEISQRLDGMMRQTVAHRQLLQSVVAAVTSLRTELDATRAQSDALSATEHRSGITDIRAAIAASQDTVVAEISRLHAGEERVSAAVAANHEALAAQTAELRTVASGLSTVARLRPPAIPGGAVTVVEVDGFLIGVPSAEWRSSSYYHYRGPMEPGVYALFKNRIRPGMFVADIGASIGLYTLLTARLLQGSGRVFSCEPTPEIFTILRNNVQLNGQLETGTVKLFNTAIADEAGHMTVFSRRDDSTHNSFYPESAGLEQLQTPVVSLDELLGPDSRLDFVKLDIEGAEPLAIRGMQGLLKNNPEIMLVMEFAPECLRRGGHDPGAFLDELTRLGLRASIIDDLTGELHAAVPSVVLGRSGTNLFLTH